MSKSTFLEDSDIAKAIADNIRNRRDGKPLHMIPIRDPYVFMNGKPSDIVYENAVAVLTPPITVSVRGHGRFVLRSFDGETRKGRLRLKADQLI